MSSTTRCSSPCSIASWLARRITAVSSVESSTRSALVSVRNPVRTTKNNPPMIASTIMISSTVMPRCATRPTLPGGTRGQSPRVVDVAWWFMDGSRRTRARLLPGLDVVGGAFLAVLACRHHRDAARARRQARAAHHLERLAPRVVGVVVVHVLVEVGQLLGAALLGVRRRPRRIRLVRVLLDLDLD